MIAAPFSKDPMNTFFTTRNIIIGVVVVLLLWVAGTYNTLVTGKGAIDGAWAQVETQYQRRFDLVPNLVSTVKGAAKFEQETLTQITEARTKWMGAGANRTEQINAAQSFDSALSRLLVTVEAYPQLQATAAFKDLMTQLEGTENRIAVARKDFNDRVMAFNVSVMRFPTNIIAGILGFTAQPYFQATPGSETAPSVQF